MSETTQPNLAEQIGGLLSPKLLDLLEQAYPLRAALPTMTDSDREIGRKLGEQHVMDFLHRCLEDANQFSNKVT